MYVLTFKIKDIATLLLKTKTMNCLSSVYSLRYMCSAVRPGTAETLMEDTILL